MLTNLLSPHYVDSICVQAAQTPREPTSAKELAKAVHELVPTARVQVDNTSVRHGNYSSDDLYLVVEMDPDNIHGRGRIDINVKTFAEAWAAFIANVEQLRSGASVRVGT